MVFFSFLILIEHSVKKQTEDTLIRFCILQHLSDLGLHCLPMSNKKDARLIYELSIENKKLNTCLLCNTVESRKFEVLGTREFIWKYRKFELFGGRHK